MLRVHFLDVSPIKLDASYGDICRGLTDYTQLISRVRLTGISEFFPSVEHERGTQQKIQISPDPINTLLEHEPPDKSCMA